MQTYCCSEFLTGPPAVPGDDLSPGAFYLAPPARRWRRWYRACSPPRTGTCLSPPGSAWRTASPRPALLPRPVQKCPPRAGEGHQDYWSASLGAHSGAQWRRGCLEKAPMHSPLQGRLDPRVQRFPSPHACPHMEARGLKTTGAFVADVCLDPGPWTLQSGVSPADRENVALGCTEALRTSLWHPYWPKGSPGVCVEGETWRGGDREAEHSALGGGGRTPHVSYLGGQRLPVPQPAHCGPGLASGGARPVEIRTDVSLPVGDHPEPLGLSCGDQGERLRRSRAGPRG